MARFALAPRLLALLCLFVLAWPPRADGAETLVLNTSARAPRSLPDGTGTQDRILKEAFFRLGVPVSIIHQPPERALINANEGNIDGDCWRIGGHSAQYPNLIMVPEPVDVATITVFTRDPALAVATWDDLRPRNVGYIAGWKVLDANVHGTRSLARVKNIDALFTLLDKNRIDAALVDPLMGWAVIRRRGLVGMRALKPALTRQDMHLYLNKRHAGLVPRLDAILRQMRRDGTISRLTRAGLGESGQ
ncbi:MAG: transporter substrate-binding domain-containing protein [Humidesulfovibrio sp.]|nr:transporter substrate-binding domain-containing protein [Humidesulfovibrio sp.]